MVPSLPPEIINHLLEYLSEDIQSLRVTSALDRQWSDITRPYIFRTITFPLEYGIEPSDLPFCPPSTAKSLDNLLSCFNRHPHLIRCVHTVSIQNTPGGFSGSDPLEPVYIRISHLLHQMENVHHLNLQRVEWTKMSLNLCQSIVHFVAHSPLTRLTTKALTIGESDMIQLLTSAPGLELLRLDNIRISLGSRSPVPPLAEAQPVILNRLRSLHLKPFILSYIFPHVIPPHAFTTLTHLDLFTRSTDDHDFGNILEAPLASLHRLKLSRLASNVAMKLPTYLTSLSISKLCDLTALCQTLQQVDGPVALERISIVVGNGYFFKPHEYVPSLEIIDRCLAKSHFHGLKTTTFRFQVEMAGSVPEEQLFTCLRWSGVNVDILYDTTIW